MASSFSTQIPVIVDLISRIRPASMLDIGKGFGKYAFLTHEYCGIDNTRRPDPTRTLREQSRVAIDEVECNTAYLWPHIDHLYRKVYVGRIESLYRELLGYELVLMCDIIEHLQKPEACDILTHFLGLNSTIIVATPKGFFQQNLYDSPEEQHVSHWTKNDFLRLGYVDYQTVGAGRIYLVSRNKLDVRGFGSGFMKRLRRIARAVVNEVI